MSVCPKADDGGAYCVEHVAAPPRAPLASKHLPVSASSAMNDSSGREIITLQVRAFVVLSVFKHMMDPTVLKSEVTIGGNFSSRTWVHVWKKLHTSWR